VLKAGLSVNALNIVKKPEKLENPTKKKPLPQEEEVEESRGLDDSV